MNKFENKNVIVTGSSRGIGFAILEMFAKERATLIACSNRQSEEVLVKYHKLKSIKSRYSLTFLICQMKRL